MKVQTADICPVSAQRTPVLSQHSLHFSCLSIRHQQDTSVFSQRQRGMCPVSTAGICPRVVLNCLLYTHTHTCAAAVVSIFAILFCPYACNSAAMRLSVALLHLDVSHVTRDVRRLALGFGGCQAIGTAGVAGGCG